MPLVLKPTRFSIIALCYFYRVRLEATGLPQFGHKSSGLPYPRGDAAVFSTPGTDDLRQQLVEAWVNCSVCTGLKNCCMFTTCEGYL